jgi:uncharacterized protein YyaL (SSP411 family)
LLQHAHNPVDWHPWGEEALSRAVQEDRPILLSIGYSACHWCHVMERESFEDAEIASLMNQHFVCVKVDREERPDIDSLYMSATTALNHGRGGWPMTVFLTPDQKPFFAGTYFPPDDRGEMPGLRRILDRLREMWIHDRPMIRTQADKLADFLRQAGTAPQRREVDRGTVRGAVSELAGDYDPHHGGFGPAPKFPNCPSLTLLLSLYQRSADPYLLRMVTHTLDRMATGGIFDQIGGGFARYSTDARWLVPHFEKMLYDNAMLVRVYLAAFQLTGNPDYERVVRQTLDFVLAEMTSDEGGFFTSLDADSHNDAGTLVEGAFYAWTPAEVAAVLGAEEARRICAYFDITEAGNFEGANVPSTPSPLADVAAKLGVSAAELRASVDAGRSKLYEARQRRPRPRQDDKVLAGINGLMIGAMAEAARVLGEERYLQAARAAAMLLRQRLRGPDGKLLRSYRAGRAHVPAYLEDYAYLCDGLIDLYEASVERSHLEEALRLCEILVADFSSDEGGFYTVASEHDTLLVRTREGHDGPTANPNAVAAIAMARLAVHVDRDDLRRVATGAVEAYGQAILRMPRGFCTTVMAADYLRQGPAELVLAGRAGERRFEALRRAVDRHYLPHRVIAYWDPDAPEAHGADLSANPLFAGKTRVDGEPALYVCRERTCDRPVLDPDQVPQALMTAST